MRILCAILMFSMLFACKSDKTSVTVSSGEGLPSIPKEEYKLLYDSCTAIDYIFNELPFSVSQSDQASVRTNLNMISQEAMDGSFEGCAHLGREFFQINGEVRYEADVYFGEGCFYHVWIVDGKPKYGNKLNVNGKNFYGNLINQARNMAKQNGQ